MGRYWLLVKADLENVTALKPNNDIRWHIKWSCAHCNEKTPKAIPITHLEQVETSKGRAMTHLLYNCKFCRRESTVDIEDGWKERSYDAEDSGKFKRIISFECRGLVPEEFEVSDNWNCTSSESSASFSNVPLMGDWADYDENSSCSVAVYAFESKFERA